MAIHGPMLQHLAVQEHLWGEASANVQPADAASPLHAAMVESAFTTAADASQRVGWEGRSGGHPQGRPLQLCLRPLPQPPAPRPPPHPARARRGRG